MSHRATLYVKDLRVCPNGEPVTQREKLVLYALADYHQDKLHRDTYPSVVTLAEESMMDVRSCRRVLDSIEAKGVLERHRGPAGRGNLTFYRFVELDGEVKKKGGVPPSFPSPSVLPQKGGKKGAERGQNAPPLMEEQKQEQKQILPPEVPQGGTCELDLEQLAHLERCSPEDRPRWERYYREENQAKAAERQREAEGLRARRETFPDRATAIERVMRECGFQRGVRRNPVPEILGQVLDGEAARGSPVWETAPRMIAAWEAQRTSGRDVKYGAVKFYRDGHWRS